MSTAVGSAPGNKFKNRFANIVACKLLINFFVINLMNLLINKNGQPCKIQNLLLVHICTLNVMVL